MRSPKPSREALFGCAAWRAHLGPTLPLVALLLVAPALVASGCADPIECGPGTRAVDGRCVAACGAGTEADPVSGECVAVCEFGTHRDEASGACLPNHALCVSGQVFDHDADRCVDVADICSAGTIWVASEQRCVHELDLRVPDQFEGDGDNAYQGYDSKCEPLILPGMGDTRSFGGRIDSPVLVDHDYAYPDDDCWSFEVEEPTLMRVLVDGLGGASGAFRLVSPETPHHVDRYGIGTSSSAVERDVFIAKPGRYIFVITDALNMTNSGPWHGGGDFGYYAEIEVLPIPEPERIVLQDGFGLARGSWPAVMPAEGSGVRFFQAAVPSDSLFMIDVRVPNYTVLPALMTISPAGQVTQSRWDSLPRPTAHGAEGDVLIAVDSERFAATGDVPFTVVVTRKEMTMLDNDSGSFSIDQPAWSQGAEWPERYFGLRVEEDEVVALKVVSSTGRTCFWVWNESMDLLAGDRGCMLYSDLIFEEEIVFEVRETGLHVILVSDWHDASTFEGNLLSIPAHSFEISLEARRQMRLPLGRLDQPVSSIETVTELDWERYFGLDPEVGDIFRFDIEGFGDFNPFFVSFRMGRLTSSMPIDWYPANHREFAFRSTNGWKQLFGVSDVGGAAGSFQFRAERYTPPKIGPFSGHATIELVEELDKGRSRYLFEVDAEVPGRLSLQVLPPAQLDLAIVPLDASLRPVGSLRQESAGVGEAVSFVHELAALPAFLEIVTADGAPVDSRSEVEIEATFSAFALEEEPNDLPTQAQAVELSVPVAAMRNDRGDLDWYSFILDSAAEIDIVTGGLGWGFWANTKVHLFNQSGIELLNHMPGSTGYAQLRDVSLSAGTYFVLVHGDGAKDNQYSLEVSHANQ